MNCEFCDGIDGIHSVGCYAIDGSDEGHSEVYEAKRKAGEIYPRQKEKK